MVVSVELLQRNGNFFGIHRGILIKIKVWSPFGKLRRIIKINMMTIQIEFHKTKTGGENMLGNLDLNRYI